MKKEDARMWVALAEFTMRTAEVQVMFEKIFACVVQQGEIDSQMDDRCAFLRAELLRLGNVPESGNVRAELEKLESGRLRLNQKYSSNIVEAMNGLRDISAQLESEHETIQALLATLKQGLD